MYPPAPLIISEGYCTVYIMLSTARPHKMMRGAGGYNAQGGGFTPLYQPPCPQVYVYHIRIARLFLLRTHKSVYNFYRLLLKSLNFAHNLSFFLIAPPSFVYLSFYLFFCCCLQLNHDPNPFLSVSLFIYLSL